MALSLARLLRPRIARIASVHSPRSASTRANSTPRVETDLAAVLPPAAQPRPQRSSAARSIALSPKESRRASNPHHPSGLARAALLERCVAKGDVASLESLIASSQRVDASDVLALARAYLAAGRPKEGVYAVRGLMRRSELPASTQLVNAVFELQLAAGESDDVIASYRQLDVLGIAPNGVTRSLAVRALASSGRYSNATEETVRIEDVALRALSLAHVAEAAAERGDFEDAARAARMAIGLDASTRSFLESAPFLSDRSVDCGGSFALRLARAQRAALRARAQLLSASPSASAPPLDAATRFLADIDVPYVTSRMGSLLNADGFRVLMDGCADAALVESDSLGATHTLRVSESTWKAVADVHPIVIRHRRLSELFAAVRREGFVPSEADYLDLVAVTVDASLVRAALCACATGALPNDRPLDAAKHVVAEMQADGYSKPDARLYTLLLRACSPAAIAVPWASMRTLRLENIVPVGLASSFASSAAYASAFVPVTAAGAPLAAVPALRYLDERLPQIDRQMRAAGLQHTSETTTAYFAALSHAHAFGLVLVAYHYMQSKGVPIPPSVYEVMICALAGSANPLSQSKALGLWHEIHALVRDRAKKASHALEAARFVDAPDQWRDSGTTSEVTATDSALNSSDPNHPTDAPAAATTLPTLLAVASAACAIDRVDDARRILRSMQNSPEVTDVCALLSRALLVAGDVRGAIQAVRAIERLQAPPSPESVAATLEISLSRFERDEASANAASKQPVDAGGSAVRTAELALADAARLGHVRHTRVSSAAVSALVSRGFLDEASNLVASGHALVDGHCLRSLVTSLVSASRIRTAEEVVVAAVKNARAAASNGAYEDSLGALLSRVFAERGLRDAAELLRRAADGNSLFASSVMRFLATATEASIASEDAAPVAGGGGEGESYAPQPPVQMVNPPEVAIELARAFPDLGALLPAADALCAAVACEDVDLAHEIAAGSTISENAARRLLAMADVAQFEVGPSRRIVGPVEQAAGNGRVDLTPDVAQVLSAVLGATAFTSAEAASGLYAGLLTRCLGVRVKRSWDSDKPSLEASFEEPVLAAEGLWVLKQMGERGVAPPVYVLYSAVSRRLSSLGMYAAACESVLWLKDGADGAALAASRSEGKGGKALDDDVKGRRALSASHALSVALSTYVLARERMTGTEALRFVAGGLSRGLTVFWSDFASLVSALAKWEGKAAWSDTDDYVTRDGDGSARAEEAWPSAESAAVALLDPLARGLVGTGDSAILFAHLIRGACVAEGAGEYGVGLASFLCKGADELGVQLPGWALSEAIDACVNAGHVDAAVAVALMGVARHGLGSTDAVGRLMQTLAEQGKGPEADALFRALSGRKRAHASLALLRAAAADGEAVRTWGEFRALCRDRPDAAAVAYGTLSGAGLSQFVRDLCFWDVWRGLVAGGKFARAAQWASDPKAPRVWRPNSRQWDSAIGRAAKNEATADVVALVNVALRTRIDVPLSAPDKRRPLGSLQTEDASADSAGQAPPSPSAPVVPSPTVAASVAQLLGTRDKALEALQFASACWSRGCDVGPGAWGKVAASVERALKAPKSDRSGLAAIARAVLLDVDDRYVHADWYGRLWALARETPRAVTSGKGAKKG